MGWPFKYRSLSFAVTFAVVMGDCALLAAPIALGFWLYAAASLSRVMLDLLWISVAISVAISLYAHVWQHRVRFDPARRANS